MPIIWSVHWTTPSARCWRHARRFTEDLPGGIDRRAVHSRKLDQRRRSRAGVRRGVASNNREETMKKHLFAAVLLASSAAVAPAKADTLDTIKQRGTVTCGVSQGVAGFSAPDDAGKWHGFDIDFCRAVAAAALGDADKV